MTLGRRLRSPALVTFLLAPVVGELVSSSEPLPGFVLVWLPLAVLYGCGALLVREYALRWRSGWLGIGLLGVAYGIVEEGLVTRAFFDPHWEDLGALATFGSDAGFNWLWAIQLVIFHAAISIGATLLIARLLFPERWREPWLGRRSRRWCLAGIAAWVVVGFFLYQPPAAYLMVAVVVIGTLIALARIARPRPARSGTAPRPRRVFLTGLLGSAAVMLVPYVFAELPNGDPGVAAMVVLATVAVIVWRARRWSVAWDDRHRLALVAGELATFVVLAPLATASPWVAATSVATAVVGFLAWRRVRRRVAALRAPEQEIAV